MPVEVLLYMLLAASTMEFPQDLLLPIAEHIDSENAQRLVNYIDAICNLKAHGATVEELKATLLDAYRVNAEVDAEEA